MAKIVNDDNQEILDAIGDMSFLPKAARDENEGREFPKIHRKEAIFRLIYVCLMAASVLSFLILLFIYGPTGNHFAKSDTGTYGVLGLLIMAIMAIAFLGGQGYGYLFDTKLSLTDEKKKITQGKALHAAFYYLAFGLFYVMVFMTMLRPHVFHKLFLGNWFMENFGTMTLIVMLLVTVGGIMINFLAPKAAKWYNAFVLALGLWIVVCFTWILSKDISLSSNYGILFLVIGALCADLALPFYCLQKKTGFKTIFSVFLSFTFFFETTALLDYAMVTLR